MFLTLLLQISRFVFPLGVFPAEDGVPLLDPGLVVDGVQKGGPPGREPGPGKKGDREEGHDEAPSEPGLKGLPFQVPVHFLDNAGVDSLLIGPETGYERIVAKDVDLPGGAAGVVVDSFQGRPAEQGLRILGPGLAQAVQNVVPALLFGQGLEDGPDGDALLELPELGTVQLALQLRLADEEDLQQLVRARLQVGQHAQVLHGLDGHVLRLIDDQDDVVAPLVLANEHRVQVVHQIRDLVLGGLLLLARGLGQWDAELGVDVLQQGLEGQVGVENKDGLHLVLHAALLQKGSEHRGLAQPHLADHGHEPLAVLQPVDHGGKGLLVAGAQIEEARVRGDVEGLALETVVGEVHSF